MSQSFTKKRDPMKTHSALQGLDVLPSESQGFWCHERAHGRPACTAQCATCRATEDEASDGVLGRDGETNGGKTPMTGGEQ